jgi:hypothetical protein
MERIVRLITQNLLEKLQSDREYYTPDDLQVLEIPEFITERVIIEMNQNLNESLSPPETEWAGMGADSVQFAWKNFIEAIKAEVRMPQTFAPSLFETAVADTLELAIQPRKAIPETLFGTDEKLTIEEIKKRIKYITVGRKLAAALARYMEKKSKASLTLEECREIVKKVDEKLIAGYNSLDWAKEAEALFLMAGPSVEPDLFRIYFEDKGITKYAGKFDRLENPVTRTEFIEILSAPDIPDTEVEFSKTDSEKMPDKKAEPSGDNKLEIEKIRKPDKKNLFIPDDSILGSFQKRRIGSGIGEDEDEYIDEALEEEPEQSEDEKESLHERFVFDDSEPITSDEPDTHGKESAERNYEKDIDDEEPPEREGVFSKREMDFDLLKKWRNIGGATDEDEPVLSETEKPFDEDDDERVASIELYNETDEDEEVPMWRAFLEREDLSELKEDESGSEEDRSYVEPVDEQEYRAAYNASMMASQIDEWLGKEKSKYVNEIFERSESDYNDAITAIIEFEDWKGASGFIRNEIFSKSNVDIFDEVAVEFTDRLHTFFLEFKT